MFQSPFAAVLPPTPAIVMRAPVGKLWAAVVVTATGDVLDAAVIATAAVLVSLLAVTSGIVTTTLWLLQLPGQLMGRVASYVTVPTPPPVSAPVSVDDENVL